MTARHIHARHAADSERAHRHRIRQALEKARARLGRRALELIGYLVVAYLIVRLLPGLETAWRSLEHVDWRWVLIAVGIECLSEMGFVMSWRAIVDPDDVLAGGGRGERVATRVAWVQLGGGMVVPGGTLSSVGVGAWILHHFGMPSKVIAERQFNLQFLNTGVDALALILFGLGLGVGLFSGESKLTLTVLPALVAALGIAAAVLIARRGKAFAPRLHDRRPRVEASITTLADAVQDTGRLLTHRAGLRSVIGAVGYLLFDVLVLWSAFIAVNAHPVPPFAVVVMAYIIGALGGSIPLPAGAGSIGGMVAMFIVYGVNHQAAVAAVVLYQAVGQLVPLVGGGIAYLHLRGRFGPLEAAGQASQ